MIADVARSVLASPIGARSALKMRGVILFARQRNQNERCAPDGAFVRRLDWAQIDSLRTHSEFGLDFP